MLNLVLLAAAAAAPQRASSEIVSGDPLPDSLRTDIVVTATRSRQERDQVGQALTILTRRAIEQRQLPTVADLLATTPGVTVTRNGGPGQPAAVRIRGAEDAQTLVLIDGVRVNDPSSPAGAFDFGNLLTGNIERIEVLRGPNSVPWGSQAIGGVVNLVTSDLDGARLTGEYGTHDNAYATAQLGTSFGDSRVSAGGGYFRDDGISAYRFGRERDGFRQYAGNARAELALDDNISLDLRGYYANSRVGFDGFPPPVFAFADTNDVARTEQSVGYAGLNAKTGPVQNRLAFTLNDVNRAATGTSPFVAQGRNERYEYQGDADLGPLRAVFGAEHERTRFADGRARYATNVTSGYLQLVATPIEPLTLTGGARIDDHKTYGTEATFSGNAALRLGRTILRVAYGEGFKAPTLFQLYSAFGNTALRPERARSLDLGIEQSFTRGRIGLTLFGRNTTDQIDFNPGRRPNRPFGFYDNIARTRARGLEAFAELRPSDRLTLNANYSYVDAKDRTTKRPLLRRPQHSINAQLDWTPLDRLRLGASVRTVSDSDDVDFVTFARTRLDGYTLVGLRAALSLTDRLELYGRVENLFDSNYEVVSGYGTLGRTAHVGVRVRL